MYHENLYSLFFKQYYINLQHNRINIAIRGSTLVYAFLSENQIGIYPKDVRVKRGGANIGCHCLSNIRVRFANKKQKLWNKLNESPAIFT